MAGIDGDCPSKTHCKHGHDWNVHKRLKHRQGHSWFYCYECRRLDRRKWTQLTRDKKRQARIEAGTYIAFASQRTHCPHGHPYSGANLIVSKNGRRRCRICSSRTNVTNKRSISEATAFLVQEAIEAGASFAEITGSAVRPTIDRIVGDSALRRFRTNNPALNQKWMALRAKLVTKSQGLVVAAPAIMKNNGHDAWAVIMDVTCGVWTGIRGDVQADMFLAISEGRLLLKEAKVRLKEFIAARNKMDKHSTFSKFGALSLDAPLYDDETGSQYDRLREDQRLWG